ncbi:MAG TPA: putative DNA-binding domain-containing protein [Draconibacterium sp.]|nr:putative DNA-binding domain-containing protein [Draconibacterium sp.]
MKLKTETYQQQSNLANYCRNGKEIEIKGAKKERIPQYRRLVFNVIKNALESTYPISYKFIERETWDEMVYRFFSKHKCSDPQVWRMPEEFYHFCRGRHYAEKYNLPFLNDLLYFEWLEVELYMMEDQMFPEIKNSRFKLNKRIAINPEHQIIKLEFPVHLIGPQEAAGRKGNYFVLLFREQNTGRIQFIDLSVLFAFLIENLISSEKTPEEIFTDILYIFGINDLNLLRNEANKLLNDLQAKGFVLGELKT